MADSKGKRIFTDRGQVPSIDPARTPSCYYHKSVITHFCVKKKCTLPLCQECLPIHKREHINNKEIPNEGILEFETARDDAISAFQQRKEEIEKIQERFRAKVTEYKSKMVQLITHLLDKFMEDSLITDGNLEIMAEIQERTNQISRGSLKELIRYYEDIYGAQHFRKLYKMYTGEYLTNFKFEFDNKMLEKLAKEGIKNMNFQAQQQQIAKHQNPPRQTAQLPLHSPIKQQSTIPEKDQKQHRKDIQTSFVAVSKEANDIQKPKVQKYEPNNHLHFPNKRKNSEEDEQSQVFSYQIIKSKKKIQEGNIYTQKPSKIVQNPSENHSQNRSNVSIGKRKKGLSLVKSNKELPTLQSSQSSNLIPPSNCDEERTENNNRKSNWKQFVNMKQTHPENEVLTAPSNEPTTVLNPKQMRQLILKKKMEEKQKELKPNRSVEFLTQPEKITN